MIKRVKNLQAIRIPFNGGLDEASAVSKIPLSEAIEMDDMRLSKDGNRTEKRKGSSLVVDSGSNTVYGYHTYYDSSSAFCQLIVTSADIRRKVGAAAWASIHTFSSAVTHPVKPLEIHGKQFVISSSQNRMIHIDKADYQVGITAPTTLPTTVSAPIGTLPLDDDMDYADQAAMDAVWTDGDSNANSVLATVDPNSTPGPDADSKYMRFYDTSYSSGDYARRSLTVKNIPSKYSLEFDLYFDALGYYPWNEHLLVEVYNGLTLLRLRFAHPWVDFYDGSTWQRIYGSGIPGTYIKIDGWQNWKFIVDASNPSGSTLQAFVDDVDQGTWDWNNQDTTASKVQITQYTAGTYANSDTYFDNIKIGGMGDASSGELSGTYKYAVTYSRSGNYPCESNPIKCIVGTATQTGGSGLDDLTSGGTYTGNITRTFRVQIDGTGTPDTFKWSEDEGKTWNSETINMTSKNYLPYGLELNWAATTGHTSGNYWTIICEVCSASAAMEKVTLSSVPTSSDAQVDQRRIYRTVVNGSTYFHLATINDNTTTTFVDNMPDAMLGDLMEEDHDVAPIGKFSAWWDERLWILDTNMLYYSQVDYPEHFDTSKRYIIIRKGESGDETTGMIEYMDELFIFMRKRIYKVIKRLDGTYSRHLVTQDIGNIAPWSLIEVNNLLMFLSYRGLELFNGQDYYSTEFSIPTQRTLSTIDTSYYNNISSCHLHDKNEVLFSIPNRTGGLSGVIVAYNYVRNRFYLFSYTDTISCLTEARNSTYALKNYMGKTNGKVLLMEDTHQDESTAISSVVRKPWIKLPETSHQRRLYVEYELPADKTVVMNLYLDFDKDVKRTYNLTGDTPSATDIDIRRIIEREIELGTRGKYVSIEFTNAENLGGDLKINEAILYYAPYKIPKDITPD